MDRKYFDYYGVLEWLEPEDYYRDGWSYVCGAEADDSEEYCIVEKRIKQADAYVEYRYTII